MREARRSGSMACGGGSRHALSYPCILLGHQVVLVPSLFRDSRCLNFLRLEFVSWWVDCGWKTDVLVRLLIARRFKNAGKPGLFGTFLAFS